MIPILILAAVLSVFGGPASADTVGGGPTASIRQRRADGQRLRHRRRGADPPIVPVT